MSETELKPCPFCGGRPHAERISQEDYPDFSVECLGEDCALNTPIIFHSFPALESWWQSRPGEEALTTAADAIADALGAQQKSLCESLCPEIGDEGGVMIDHDPECRELRAALTAYRALRSAND